MTNSIHIANSKGRDATVGLLHIQAPEGPKMGLPNERMSFQRYLAATESTTHDALTKQFGENYAQHLLDGDPEVDMESVGLRIEHTQTVYLDGDQKLLYVEPQFIDLLLNPDGAEKERRAPIDVDMNVVAEVPVRFSGRLVPIQDAVRRFVFKRKLQLHHVDGLTFDFLYEMAKDLEGQKALMVIGAGDKGTQPLIFQANGKPYRGFLEGKTQDKSYQLVLHLSEMELKKPVSSKSTTSEGEAS
ncbi:hypothetical protein [Polynucleobacter sp. JS-Polo-80-F4]|uniref:hypothetical protein n=1 Tax=Polynucleobacter sp. JS-Polo-80-F4 TaxID=2576918 RepID=UPI001C0DB9D3|nr:hypothetical protein [Polynucleobacter sp. JS-Polo-80-F4]MBU3617262.1 hypothetical protein [Polynucleobacter sp. JS-Polo-80-F4]